MTKKGTLLLLLLILFTGQAQAQTPTPSYHRANDEKHAGGARAAQTFDDPTRVSPNRAIVGQMGDSEVIIEWGAPRVRGRQVSGGLVSTYKVWRTGANEATTIHFDEDVLIEGEPLAAGTYALFTIGGKKNWTWIFSNDHHQWGAFTYNRGDDALRVKTEPGAGEHQEELLFSFLDSSEGETWVQIRWGTMEARFHVQLATQSD